jgi:hypothetical protein
VRVTDLAELCDQLAAPYRRTTGYFHVFIAPSVFCKSLHWHFQVDPSSTILHDWSGTNSCLTLTAMHPGVEIGCAEAPQFSDPHSAYRALASESLKCLRMDLQQGCRLARIEESLEMRERLADWCCFVHLAHKTPCGSATRFTPLCIKEPAEGEKHRKIARRSSRLNCTERDREEEVRGVCPAEGRGLSTTLAKGIFLCKIPIGPQF